MISDPYVKVQCDGCPESEEYSLHEATDGGCDYDDLHDSMAMNGWFMTDDKKTYCLDCADVIGLKMWGDKKGAPE